MIIKNLSFLPFSSLKQHKQKFVKFGFPRNLIPYYTVRISYTLDWTRDRTNQLQSVAISCNQLQSVAVSCNQLHSVAIRCTQFGGTVKKVYVNLTRVTYFQNFELIFYLGTKIEKTQIQKFESEVS